MVGLMFLCFCKKEKVDYFPNQDGNYWIYEYQTPNDTFLVHKELCGYDNIDGVKVQRLLEINLETNDTSIFYFSKTEDSVFIYTYPYLWSKFVLAVYSLKEGNEWLAYEYTTGGETYKVMGRVECEEFIEGFGNAIKISYEPALELSAIWVINKIGIVKLKYKTGEIELLKEYGQR